MRRIGGSGSGGDGRGGDGDGRGLDAAVGGLVDVDGDDRRRLSSLSSFSRQNRGEERRVRAGCCQSLEGLDNIVVEERGSSSSNRGASPPASAARGGPRQRGLGRDRRPGQQRRAGERVGGQQRRERVARGGALLLLFFVDCLVEVVGDPEGVDGASGEVLGVRDDCFNIYILKKGRRGVSEKRGGRSRTTKEKILLSLSLSLSPSRFPRLHFVRDSES